MKLAAFDATGGVRNAGTGKAMTQPTDSQCCWHAASRTLDAATA